jgi:hypothetical protein
MCISISLCQFKKVQRNFVHSGAECAFLLLFIYSKYPTESNQSVYYHIESDDPHWLSVCLSPFCVRLQNFCTSYICVNPEYFSYVTW